MNEEDNLSSFSSFLLVLPFMELDSSVLAVVERCVLDVSLVDESAILSIPGTDSAEAAAEWGRELRSEVDSLITDFIQDTQAHNYSLDSHCANKAHDLKTALRMLGCNRAAVITEIIENTAIKHQHSTAAAAGNGGNVSADPPRLESSSSSAAAAVAAAVGAAATGAPVQRYLVDKLQEVYISTLPTLNTYPWLKLE